MQEEKSQNQSDESIRSKIYIVPCSVGEQYAIGKLNAEDTGVLLIKIIVTIGRCLIEQWESR
ncbi:MAG: hypothetical protein K2J99_10245 [Lachnospiraceae bacterium]|nr:hypothetical protein [Lachnospiraceae bacterium]